MAIKKISKSIIINAPQIKVWNALFGDDTYPQWAAMFMEGSTADTDWKEGSTVKFQGTDGSGLFGVIEKNQPFDFLSIRYKAVLTPGGIEDYESDEAKEFAGSVESYSLAEHQDGTHLAIESDMSEKYIDEMSGSWDKALLKIKEIAENN